MDVGLDLQIFESKATLYVLVGGWMRCYLDCAANIRSNSYPDMTNRKNIHAFHKPRSRLDTFCADRRQMLFKLSVFTDRFIPQSQRLRTVEQYTRSTERVLGYTYLSCWIERHIRECLVQPAVHSHNECKVLWESTNVNILQDTVDTQCLLIGLEIYYCSWNVCLLNV